MNPRARTTMAALAAAFLLTTAAPAGAGVDRWTEAGPGGTVQRVALAAADPLLLYAATDGCTIWRSDDAGGHWRRRGRIPRCGGETVMLAAPGPGDAVWAAVTETDELFPDFGLWRSDDGGRPWRRLLAASILTVFVHPQNPSLVLAGGRGIFRSADGGESWRQVFPGAVPVPPGGFGTHAFTTSSIYGDPEDRATVYANISEYITGSLTELCAVSHDRGRTWSTPAACPSAAVFGVPDLELAADSCDLVWPVSILCPAHHVFPTPEVPMPPGDVLIVVPSEPPVLYASDPAAEQGFVSRDGGRTWSAVAGWTELFPPLPGSAPRFPPRLFVHPAAPERLFQLAEGRLHRATFVGAQPLAALDCRFETRVAWRHLGAPASGARPLPIDGETGAFWFSRPNNLELAVKVLDRRAEAGRFEVVQTALSNIEYEVTVADLATGRQRTWFNPPRRLAARVDRRTFVEEAPGAGAASRVPPAPAVLPATPACRPTGTVACLFGRFAVEASWRDRAGALRRPSRRRSPAPPARSASAPTAASSCCSRRSTAAGGATVSGSSTAA